MPAAGDPATFSNDAPPDCVESKIDVACSGLAVAQQAGRQANRGVACRVRMRGGPRDVVVKHHHIAGQQQTAFEHLERPVSTTMPGTLWVALCALRVLEFRIAASYPASVRILPSCPPPILSVRRGQVKRFACRVVAAAIDTISLVL